MTLNWFNGCITLLQMISISVFKFGLLLAETESLVLEITIFLVVVAVGTKFQGLQIFLTILKISESDL